MISLSAKVKFARLTILTLIFLGAVGLIALGLWDKTRVNQEQEERLKQLYNRVHQSLDTWAEKHKQIAKSVAKNRGILYRANQLLERKQKNRSLRRASIQYGLAERLNFLWDTEDYVGYQIISPDYQIISDLDDRQIGKIHPLAGQKLKIESVWQGDTKLSLIFFDPVKLEPEVTSDSLIQSIPTPINVSTRTLYEGYVYVLSPMYKEEEIVAVMALQLDFYQAIQPIIDRGKWSAWGDSFVFNSEAEILSVNQFADHENSKTIESILFTGERMRLVNIANWIQSNAKSYVSYESLPLTYLAQAGIRKENGLKLSPYKNNLNDRVIGIWGWHSTFDFGIGIELPEIRAFAGHYLLMLVASASWLLFAIITWFGLRNYIAVQNNNIRQWQRSQEIFEQFSGGALLIKPDSSNKEAKSEKESKKRSDIDIIYCNPELKRMLSVTQVKDIEWSPQTTSLLKEIPIGEPQLHHMSDPFNRPVSLEKYNFYDPEKEQNLWLLTIVDESESRRHLKRIFELEQLNLGLINTGMLGIAIFEINGVCRLMNAGAKLIWELTSTHSNEIEHLDGFELLPEKLHYVFDLNTSFQQAIFTANIKDKQVQLDVRRVGYRVKTDNSIQQKGDDKEYRVILFARDVTKELNTRIELQQAQAILDFEQETEARQIIELEENRTELHMLRVINQDYLMLMDASKQGVIHFQEDGIIDYLNPIAMEMVAENFSMGEGASKLANIEKIGTFVEGVDVKLKKKTPSTTQLSFAGISPNIIAVEQVGHSILLTKQQLNNPNNWEEFVIGDIQQAITMAKLEVKEQAVRVQIGMDEALPKVWCGPLNLISGWLKFLLLVPVKTFPIKAIRLEVVPIERRENQSLLVGASVVFKLSRELIQQNKELNQEDIHETGRTLLDQFKSNLAFKRISEEVESIDGKIESHQEKDKILLSLNFAVLTP